MTSRAAARITMRSWPISMVVSTTAMRPPAAVAERYGLLVDHDHVAGAVARQAAERLAGDLAGDQLLEMAFRLGASAGLRRGRAGCERRTDQKESNATHNDLLIFPMRLCRMVALTIMNGSCLCPP